MRLTSAACSAFSISDSPRQVGPSNFFHPEQKALGKLVMITTQGQYGAEHGAGGRQCQRTRSGQPVTCNNC